MESISVRKRYFRESACPACNLLPLEKVTSDASQADVPPITLPISQHNVESFERYAPKCDFCQLLVDLYRYWSSADCNKQLPHESITYSSLCGRSDVRIRYTDHSYLGLAVDFDSVLAKRVDDRRVESDPLSDHSIRLMKHWMAKCERKHTHCCIDEVPLPTRVIDVPPAAANDLKLVETEGRKGGYIALSHCWGSCKAFLTTRATLEDRRRGFQLEDLPATFRDAVLVTQKLGFRYLWIDSLCILQGDKEDWEIESSKMADVYENATLTIAAANAADDGEGFVKKHEEIALPVDIQADTGYRARIFVQPRATRTAVQYEPLDGRAWCLQERYLSTRRLFFDSNALRWKCAQSGWFEIGRGLPSKRCLVRDVMPLYQTPDSVSYFGWYEMVEYYTCRAITYEGDKLPALSALAERVARESRDTYLAGLWKEDILRGMLWYRQVRRGFRTHESSAPFSYPTKRKPDDNYIAPSWSWASFHGAIQFDVTLPSDAELHVHPCVKYIDASLNVPGKNPFGMVEPGWLRLRGPLLSLEPDPYWERTGISEATAHRSWERNMLYCPEFDDIDVGIVSSFDYPEEPVVTCFALPLALAEDKAGNYYYDMKTAEDGAERKVVPWYKVHGIILRQLDDLSGTYQRIGSFSVQPISMANLDGCLESVDIRDMKII